MESVEGQIDLSKIPGLTDDQRREIKETSDAMRANISPPGAFPHLPQLLDERRIKYGLVDGMFKSQPIFDCVWIYQLEFNTGDAYVPGGRIVKADQAKSREKNEAPRGILVGAGLAALDALKSHGVELGHIVRFIKLAPFRIPVDFDNKYVYVLQMRVGDILSSDDLAAQLRAGVYRTADISGPDQAPDHRYIRKFDQYPTPIKRMPFVPEDS